MAKSDDDGLSSINLAEAGKEADNELSRINSAEVGEEAGRELGVEITADNELSRINSAEAGTEAGRELGVEITADNELSRINSAAAGTEAGRELGVEITADNESGSVELKASDKEWIISIVGERPNASSYKPLLPKVPRELREKEQNKGFFNPTVVSIGPYHHGKPEFKEAEKLKNIAASGFIASSKEEPHEVYKKMVVVVSDAKNFYIEGSTDAYDDVAFARMMLLDGCFILYFISALRGEEEMGLLDDHLGIAVMRGIIADISLLENQLPFVVLQALISTTSAREGEWEEMIESFIARVYIDGNATQSKRTYKHEKKQPLHLLDLIRRRFVGQYTPADEQVSSSGGKIYQDDGPANSPLAINVSTCLLRFLHSLVR
ncbi:uncharacterized protein LOC132300409 [Cornus florida]|uniref:uncharacterized protein LOC132300409 n=1 Tax=Cornus florida TaxID=4283 RepID=UPI0028A149E0|nr:uncharacterized protein LOC132300409 [Cornus florida]XP_059653435.1 uncharacterized protein LOC132300409 [Cornus florida]XP_059653436.1 uncharacterized protein LOC132300409 [Cornus florida]XP_059653437.1 uncharacterized protein LOC132300409 [Cornus florida]